MRPALRSLAALSAVAVAVLLVAGCSGGTPPAPTAAPTKAPAQPAAAAQPAAPAKPTAAPAAATAAPAFPTRPINFMIPNAAGGGTAITAETINKIMTDEKLSPQPLALDYRPGGNGAVGWTYLFGKKGDAHNIGITNSGIVANPLTADVPFTLKDFTPIALLATDEMVLVSNPSSSFKSAQDVINAAKQSPKSVKVAVAGATGVDAIAVGMTETLTGAKFNAIPFNSGAEMVAAVLGNQVDLAVLNPTEVAGNVEAGKLRAVALYADQRMPMFKDVPTMKELGWDIQAPNPRGIVAAGSIAPHEQKFLVDLFKKVYDSKQWAEFTSKGMMTAKYLGGADYGTFLEDMGKKFTPVYEQMGILKKK